MGRPSLVCLPTVRSSKSHLAACSQSCTSSTGTDGWDPFGILIQASDGNFYGTTHVGGTHDDGTVFKITSDGVFTIVHSFDGTDGKLPVAGLVQATDGNLYGTTSFGGPGDGGTIFQITPGGVLTTLHYFCSQTNCIDGGSPLGTLVQATDRTFYGTTNSGGASQNGTVFRFSMGLGPFVTTVPTARGRAGDEGGNPRNEPDRGHQRHIQRQSGNVHRSLANRDHHHGSARGDYGYGSGRYTRGHAIEQHSFPGVLSLTASGALTTTRHWDRLEKSNT